MPLPHMVDLPLHEALGAFDAMIGVITLDDSIAVPIELDSIPDSGDAMVDVVFLADGAVEGSAVEVEGSNTVGISVELNLGTGTGLTLSTEAISNMVPDTAIDAADAGIASGSIPTGPAINRFNRGHLMAPT